MSGFWLVSYIVLWLLAIGTSLVILALAREVEALHIRLDEIMKCISQADFGANGREADKREIELSKQSHHEQSDTGTDQEQHISED